MSTKNGMTAHEILHGTGLLMTNFMPSLGLAGHNSRMTSQM